MNFKIILKVLVFLIALFFLYSLIQRPPDIDDAWLGEHAYWQAKLGYVKSELMHGITQQETRFLCHHKLLTLQGALFITVFGFSVYTLKSLSLVYLFIFLGLFYLYTYKKVLSPLEFWFSILLFISNALIFQFAYVYRPEMAVMTFGFISYVFLDKSLKVESYSTLYVAISGLFAGLCVATHLNGIVFPIAGFVLLLWNKKLWQGLIFGLSTLPAISIYFYDFTATYNFRFWLYQLNETPAHDRISDLPVGLNYLNNLLTEHMRFFHSPLEISFSILFIASIILLHKQLKTWRNLICYLFLLVISLALFSVHKSSKYMIIYMPYLVILISLSVKHLFDRKFQETKIIGNYTYRKARLLVSILIVAYLSVNIYYDIQVATNKYHPGSEEQLISRYIDGPASRYRIIAPMTFIFYGMNRFESIQSELCYSEMQKSNKKIYGKGFLSLANSYNIDYIILSEQFISKLGMDKITTLELSESRFEILSRSPDLMILKNLTQTGR